MFESFRARHTSERPGIQTNARPFLFVPSSRRPEYFEIKPAELPEIKGYLQLLVTIRSICE